LLHEPKVAGVKTYVINLARSPDRRRYIEAELERAQMPYEIVAGVDGRELDLNDKSIVDPALKSKSYFNPGVVGCALSHMRVYSKVLADGAPIALVLEDDVALPTHLTTLVDEVAAHMSGAEAVLLDCAAVPGTQPLLLSAQGAVPLPSSRFLAFPLDLRLLNLASAYLITGDACERMTARPLPVRTHADDWWGFYREGALDRVRCVTPPPVQQNRDVFRSTIDYFAPRRTHTRLREAVVRHRVPLLYQARALRNHLRARRQQPRLVKKPSPQLANEPSSVHSEAPTQNPPLT
jgi:glycosyl transferase family 25